MCIKCERIKLIKIQLLLVQARLTRFDFEELNRCLQKRPAAVLCPKGRSKRTELGGFQIKYLGQKTFKIDTFKWIGIMFSSFFKHSIQFILLKFFLAGLCIMDHTVMFMDQKSFNKGMKDEFCAIN